MAHTQRALRQFILHRMRHFSSSSQVVDRGMKVAIVGSGPSGFYTAKYLLRTDPKSVDENTVKEVTMFDRLPVPFGLVRFGVAPDHPEVKNVVDDFSSVASDPRFKFMGNVELSDTSSSTHTTPHVTLNELRNEFDAVVLTYGAESDRKLNIKGENLEGVLSARSFVNWYNGHPEYAHLSDMIATSLERNPNVVILGHGNVALDCARIIAKAGTKKEEDMDPTGGLSTTDITQHSLDVMSRLRDSHIQGVQTISVVGRRGGAQASFTIKELREMTKLSGVKFSVNKFELEKSNTPASLEEVKANRPKQRLAKLIEEVAANSNSDEVGSTIPEVLLRFLMLPQEINAEKSGRYADSIKFKRAELSGTAGSQRAVPVQSSNGEKEEEDSEVVLPAGLVLTAVGWQSIQADSSLPFNHDRCVIPTTTGARVVMPSSSTSEGGVAVDIDSAPLYAAGWIRRGPSGIIGSNIMDSKEAAGAVLEDYRLHSNNNSGNTTPPSKEKKGYEGIKPLISARGNISDWIGWLKIHKVESDEGKVTGKPREKIVSVGKMLQIALSEKENSV